MRLFTKFVDIVVCVCIIFTFNYFRYLFAKFFFSFLAWCVYILYYTSSLRPTLYIHFVTYKAKMYFSLYLDVIVNVVSNVNRKSEIHTRFIEESFYLLFLCYVFRLFISFARILTLLLNIYIYTYRDSKRAQNKMYYISNPFRIFVEWMKCWWIGFWIEHELRTTYDMT